VAYGLSIAIDISDLKWPWRAWWRPTRYLCGR